MKQAPDFALPNQNGETRTLPDYAGKWLVLYFYPEDDTPGCTTEACSFRDERDAVAELGNAEVVGVSKDSVESHQKFIEKYQLNFTLLSDPGHKTIDAYDSWDYSASNDPNYNATLRNTFIIDPNGNIAKEYRGVDPKTHAAQIIADLQTLQAAG